MNLLSIQMLGEVIITEIPSSQANLIIVHSNIFPQRVGGICNRNVTLPNHNFAKIVLGNSAIGRSETCDFSLQSKGFDIESDLDLVSV